MDVRCLSVFRRPTHPVRTQLHEGTGEITGAGSPSESDDLR